MIILTILIILIFVYVFIGGMIFRDMLDKLLLGYWPLIGAFLLSVLWVPFFTWIAINLRCEITGRWYLKFGKTIFIGG